MMSPRVHGIFAVIFAGLGGWTLGLFLWTHIWYAGLEAAFVLGTGMYALRNKWKTEAILAKREKRE